MTDHSSSKVMQNHKLVMIMLTILIFLVITCQFASDSFLPSLPAITEYFNTTTSLSQLTITAYLMGLSASQIFYGILSDRFGRRNILTLGLFVFFLGTLLCYFASSIHMLILGRLIQGSGIGAILALLRPMLCDCFADEKLAQIGSYFGTIISVTPALAPIVGGYLQVHFGWKSIFLLLTAVSIIILLVTYFFMPETIAKRNLNSLKLTKLKENTLQMITHKMFMGYAICAGLAFSGVIAYSAISPYLFQNVLKLTPVAYGWLAIYTSVALAIGAFLNGKLVKKIKILPMLSFGLALTCLAGLSMYLFYLFGLFNLFTVLVPTMVYFFALGFIMSNVFAGAFSAFRNVAGLAGSVYGSIQMFIAFATSGIVAGLARHNQRELSLIYLVLAITMIFIVWFVNRGAKGY